MHSENILPHKNFPPLVDAARGQIKTGPAWCRLLHK